MSKLLALAGVAVVALSSTGASAASYTFDFSSGGLTLALGSLTTADTPDSEGAYAVTSISGVIGANTITGLLTAPTAQFTFDNRLEVGAADPLLDAANDITGLGIATTGDSFNIYYAVGGFGGTAVTPDGLFDGAFTYPAGNVTGTFTLTPDAGAVPEPASWAMFIGGFGVIGCAARRRRGSISFA